MKKIYQEAFSECENLENIVFDDLSNGSVVSLDLIGERAFSGCKNLKNFFIPSQRMNEDLGAVIPPSVTTLGNYCFEECIALKQLDIQSPLLQVIPSGAFRGCKEIQKVNLEEGLLEIGTGAFSGTAIKEITIPHSVTTICGGDYGGAFGNCTSLETLYVGAGLTDIQAGAFQGCKNLGKISFEKIPSNQTSKLQKIGHNAFIPGSDSKNEKLTDVVFPCPELESIGERAFMNFEKLKNADLTQTKITEVPWRAFYDTGAEKVGVVKVAPKNSRGLYVTSSGTKGILLPSTVMRIADDAFGYCQSLKEIDIPGTVAVESGAFAQTVWEDNMSNGLNYIGCSAYKYVGSMPANTILTIRDGTATIAKNCFYNRHNLVTVILPSTMTEIGEYAFYDSGLKDIYCYATTPPVVKNENAFSDYAATLHVAEGCSEAYMIAEVWKNFTTIVESWSEEHQNLLNRYDELMTISLNGLNSIIAAEHHALIQGVNQLSSPNTETSEGSLAALIDEDTNTFWHSTWKNGSVAGGTHYLQVELIPPADMDVYATFTRRKTQNDHVTGMSVYGTHNAEAGKGYCEELLTFDCPYTSNTETITSPHFQSKGYRYLRFYANSTTSNNGYWHMAELQLYGENNVSPQLEVLMESEATNLRTVIEQQSAISRKDISEEDYNALKEAYDAFMAKLTELSGQDADVTIKAKSYTREYGEANPIFDYTVEGALLEGQPEITCEATATSPVGKYPIIIKKGSVTNSNDTYVNGILTITKAPLTIAVGNYTLKQGETIPEFTLTYTGFKNNETKNVLTKQPVVSCNATSDSAPGEYPITVSGAKAQNYDIIYTNGTLKVTAADVNPKLVETFTLNCKRGYLGSDGVNVIGTTKANASKLAIIEYGNTNYLYDVTHSSFVVHTAATKAGITGNPTMESNTAIEKAVTGLSWGNTGIEEYPFYLEDSFGNWLNMDQRSVVYMNTWKDFESGNGGNTYQKNIVDVDYDATEALEILDNYFHPSNTVTYVFTELGSVVSRSAPLAATVGMVINEVPVELRKDYCTYSVTPTTIKSGDNIVNVEVSSNLPFEASASYEAAKWYWAKIRYTYYLNISNSEPYYPIATKQETNNFQWAFMGTPHTGFVILNKAAGAGACLTKDGNYALMRQSNERWDLIRNESGGFNLLRCGSELDYITQYGGNTGYLGFWVDTRGRTDVGGMWLLEEVTTNIKGINENSSDAMIYNLNGIRLSKPQRGINILRMSDGTTKKVLIK